MSLCSQTESISVQAYDLDAALQSNELTLPANEEINPGVLTVCEDLENYIRINVDGQQTAFFNAELRIVDSADVSITQFYVHNTGNNNNIRIQIEYYDPPIEVYITGEFNIIRN